MNEVVTIVHIPTQISSFFGLAPLRFERRYNGFKVSISNAMCIYSYILVTVSVILTLFGLVAETNVSIEVSVRMSSRISQVVLSSDMLMVAVIAGAGVYGAPKRMREMFKLMESIALVDHSVGTRYSHTTERKLCAILLAILIFFFILIVDDCCFYALQAVKYGKEWNVAINYLGFYLMWCMAMILELQFAFTALSVRARFQAVNDTLALTAKLVTAPVTGEPRLVVLPCEVIGKLACLHGTLCDLMQTLDRSYGLPLVLILVSTLLHLIETPYFFVIEIIHSTNRVHFLMLQFLWLATHMLRIFVVVEPCHYMIAEGKRTKELVCRLMRSAPSKSSLPLRLEVFSRQLLLQSTAYSPMGMCTLDRPLFVSVLGAVTTYLVIIIQFQRYDTGNNKNNFNNTV